MPRMEKCAWEVIDQPHGLIRSRICPTSKSCLRVRPSVCVPSDTDLRYTQINAALAAINGRPISEHIGRTLGEILPEMAPTVEPAFHQVLQTGKPILNHDVRGRLPFDPEIERCWICNYYPLVSQEGAVRGVACTVQEVTERTRADEARQNLLDAISQAHSGFILGDDPRTLFDGLLRALLSLTDSEYGFIGEILRPPSGDSYLKTQAITNIAWNEENTSLLRCERSIRVGIFQPQDSLWSGHYYREDRDRQ